MLELNIGLLVVAGSAVVLGLLSKPLKRLGIPESVLLLLLGILLGPTVLGWLDPARWGNPMRILEQAARLALAVSLMGVALRLPNGYPLRHWRSLALVLGVGMPVMWLCSSALAGVVLGLPVGVALLLGAIVTPTDPVVASALTTGPVARENLPACLRHIISAESGANDGLAYLFVMTGVFALTVPHGGAMAEDVLGVLLGDILGALLAGGLIGHLAGLALRTAEAHDVIEQPSILMFTMALALATLAIVELLGSDGILAVFIAGLAFDQQVDLQSRTREEHVVEGIDRFFTAPIFILLGLMLPLAAWSSFSWPLFVTVALILLLRRLPLFLLFAGRTADLRSIPDSAFAGWFGPIGVAALYYVALAHHEAGTPSLWPIVSLIVVMSILLHGFTATPLSRLYARHRRAAQVIAHDA